jgi:Ca2+-binding EF-hand superfamily protein
MFLMLDESKDGFLQVEEIRRGMDEVFGRLTGDTGMDYRELIRSLDRDNNGVIDY